jgi:ribose-phosphate pyrophosphokinase
MDMEHGCVVVQFNAPGLGSELAHALTAPLLSASVIRFADTECDVVLDRPFHEVHNKSVLLVAQFGNSFAAWSVNDFLLSLCFLASRIRAAGAASLTCVLPYYPYARQDAHAEHGGISSVHMLANLFKSVGIDRVITFDFHNARLLEQASFPIENISCKDFWARELGLFMQELGDIPYVLVAPDGGAALRVQAVARELGIEACFVAKRRVEINQASAVSLSGNVAGRYALVLDDIIDTGRTAVSAAQLVLNHGAVGVSGFFTHAVLSSTSLAVMQVAPFDRVMLADTLHPTALGYAAMSYVSITPFITESIVKTISSSLGQSLPQRELYEPRV